MQMVAVFTGELPVEIGWFDLSVDGQMNRVNSRNGFAMMTEP